MVFRLWFPGSEKFKVKSWNNPHNILNLFNENR